MILKKGLHTCVLHQIVQYAEDGAPFFVYLIVSFAPLKKTRSRMFQVSVFTYTISSQMSSEKWEGSSREMPAIRSD